MANPFTSSRFLSINPFIWRCFYAIGIIGLGVQQIMYKDFRPVIMPPWPAWIHGRVTWAYMASAILIVAGIALFFEKTARLTATLLGTLMFLLVICFHIPYQASVNPHVFGAWTNGFKELSFSGGAFIIAASLSTGNSSYENILQKLIPLWRFFFSVTLVAFGVMHFTYTDFCASLVPKWIPGAYPWTYFAGIALIAGGAGMILNVFGKLAANLTGLMLFIWFLILHIPRAIVDPTSGDGNEWSSVFECLAYSGVAFLSAATMVKELIVKKASYAFEQVRPA